MSLLKFFWNQTDPGSEFSQADDDWDGDLLGHPDIASMSQRELADLPLPTPIPKRLPQRQLEKYV